MRFDTQPKPRFRYSPAVRMGPFVKTAGMIGLDPATGDLVSGGVEAEFARILGNLSAMLDDNGLARADIMSATLYTTVMHRFAAINALWDGYFDAVPQLPARTSVGVSQLPLGAQIEADFLLYREGGGVTAR